MRFDINSRFSHIKLGLISHVHEKLHINVYDYLNLYFYRFKLVKRSTQFSEQAIIFVDSLHFYRPNHKTF